MLIHFRFCTRHFESECARVLIVVLAELTATGVRSVLEQASRLSLKTQSEVNSVSLLGNKLKMSYGRPPPDVEGMTSLKVDNLTYRTSPETLRRVFEKYGRVGDVYIPRDRYTKESRGFAFVRFHDKRDAEDAMDAMDGAILDGRELRVQMARYGRPPDSYYGGRRGGGAARRHGGHGRRSRR